MTKNLRPELRFGLWYDFRNPPRWRRPYDRIYEEILEQIAWAEQIGFDDVWLSEHHFLEDGYSPSLLPIASAIAARTKKIRIATGIALLPFYNPIRLAEDGATVDVISSGRFELGVAVGYRVDEFEGFAIPIREKGGRTDEALEIITRLWDGETLTFKGKYFELNNVKISPEPIQKPRPPIWIGGFVPASVRRTVKYGDGFVGGGGPIEGIYKQYVDELKKAGKPTDSLRIADGIPWLIVSDDPEKTWNEAADHVIYQVNRYEEWFRKAGLSADVYEHITDREQLRKSGRLNVVDVDTCIKMIENHLKKAPLTHFLSFTIPPGLPAKWAEPHLELFAAKVIPAFR
ncbi:MAG TPA: LLM class flavin-dependent oxidoreductase [Thermodesulfobacteriota bacterium]|nr:LLM class flavin-dependent oxidoreductase [Thermodesulfobacteriota bacterium]